MLRTDEEKMSALSSIPLGAAAQAAISLYEKITGYEYSEADIKRLTELKHIFQEVLQNMAPVSWELDAENKPTHRMSPHKWSDHVRQLSKGKHKIGRFHYQGSLIAEYASTYLAERGKRWLGSGSPGDLLEQFIGEWVNFALNELPTLDYDEESVKKIRLRIKYLERIQKHEFLFKFGTITRYRNKFDTIESIKQQLYSSADLALKESMRQCAREKLELCCANSAGLLLASVKSLYYARSTPVYHEPLELQCFLYPKDSFLTGSAKDLYPKIKMTHTGAMINELVSVAGLEVFGAVNSDQQNAVPAEYFSSNDSPNNIAWANKSFDLPPWISAEKSVSLMRDYQKMAESAVRLAKLKHLVETAYDLTGKIGDLWAYGDTEGKLSLNALLFLLEKELDIFYQRFDKIYQFQNRQRHIYNLTYRIDPDNEINKNFNKVDEQYEDVNKFYDSLKKAITSIHQRMAEFTEEEARRIDTKKKTFYKSVSQYVKQYYPEYYNKYQALEQASQRDDETLKEGEEGESIKEYEEIQVICYSFNKQSKASLELLADELFKIWKRDFISRYKEDHLELQDLKLQFRKKVDSQMPIESIRLAVKAVKNQAELLKNFAEFERPYWSFSSLGWPFNREMTRNVDLITADLDSLLKEVSCSIGEEDNPDLSQTEQASSSTQSIAIAIELAVINNTASLNPAPSCTKTEEGALPLESRPKELRPMQSFYCFPPQVSNKGSEDPSLAPRPPLPFI